MASGKVSFRGIPVNFASGRTPSTTDEGKIVSDSSFFGKYVPIGLAIFTGGVWYFNISVVTYIAIKSDGIYAKLNTTAWGNLPCMVIMAKTS